MNTKTLKGLGTAVSRLVGMSFNMSAAALMLAGLFTSQAAQAQQWPTQPGSQTITYQTPWDGRTREVHVHLPSGFSMMDGIARPLVVALHGGVGSGPTFEDTTGYDLKADDENFIVVFPTGTGNPLTWNAWNASTECCGQANTNQVDDVRFLREMVLSLLDAYTIDPAKVYAVGFSNGAVMSWRLGCDAADLFDAIGMDAGDSTALHPDGSSCDLGGRTVRVVNLHGEDDLNMPYMGGDGMGLDHYIRQPVEDPHPDLYGGETDIGLWTGLNGCAFTPVVPPEITPAYVKKIFCGTSGLQVVNYMVLGEDHKWYTTTNSAISSTDITWDFFKNGAAVPPLFSDGFESGNFTTGGWTTTGSPVVSSSAAHVGNKGARLRGTSSITRLVSTVGIASIKVEYDRRTTGLDSGEHLYVEWSTNGISWTLIETTRTTIWNATPISVVLPEGAAGQSGFRIRFRTNASSILESARIDDVKVLAN